MRSKRRLRDPSGFTLVEVMVAILLLSIGVLATVSLADNANRSTNTTKAREGATNVARDVLEGVHAVPYSSLTQSLATGRVQAINGLADGDAAKAGWQIVRRNTSYTVALTVCSVDDPADGFAASHDSSFCALAGASAKPADSNPVDYKRATVNVSWSDQQGTRSLTQATTVTNIDNGPVPRVTPRSLSGPPWVVTSASLSSITFDVATDQPAANVDWTLGGTKQGAAAGSGTAWSFVWPIGAATGGSTATPGCSPTGTGKLDGTYFVGAQAYNSSNVSPGPQAATVQLNRCAPLPVTGAEAGKSSALNKLEVQWDDSPEDDVVGYKVERSLTSSTGYSLITAGKCAGLLTKPDCIDDDPTVITTTQYFYRVYAYDRDSSGTLRQGDYKQVNTLPANRPPTTPSLFNGSSYGYTLVWPLSTDPDTGDTVDYYWVYRDGQLVGSRWDATQTFTAQGVGWNDPDPSGGPHNYWVTAVDNHGNESTFSNLVTR